MYAPGVALADVGILRNGVPVPDCSVAGVTGQATPDPCIGQRSRTGDVVSLSVRTSHASTWTPVAEQTDKTPPVITCPSPAPTVGFRATGAILTASVADNAGGAVVASPTVTVALATTIAGNQSVTVAASDLAGNVGTSLCAYRVAYTLASVMPSVTNQLRSAPANQTVPITFTVLDATGQPVTGNVVTAPTSKPIVCPAGTAVALVSSARFPEGLINLGSGNWYAGWRTQKAWRNTCRTVTVAFTDGSTLAYKVKIT